MTNPDQKETELMERIRTELDNSESSLDADTLRELRLARGRAIEKYKAGSLQKPWQLWQPVGAVAIAATVAAVAVSVHLSQQDETSPLQSIEDMQLLSAGDELELYEELEFYQWLEFEERRG